MWCDLIFYNFINPTNYNKSLKQKIFTNVIIKNSFFFNVYKTEIV